jgi:hypothetical protein
MPCATRFLLFSGEWGNVWLARLNLTWERGFSLCLLRLCLGARSISGLAFCACSAPGGGRGFAVCSAEPGTFRAKKPSRRDDFHRKCFQSAADVFLDPCQLL